MAEEVLKFLEEGWHGHTFGEIVSNLRTADPYMVMADFADYRKAQARVSKLYQNPSAWGRMSLANIAGSGVFSADRAVLEYAKNIWKTEPVKW